MKRLHWQIALGLSLVAVSSAVYVAQILVFRQAHDTFFYMFQDFAFVPVQVLLVTLIINEMLSVRERAGLRKKMNMVIGAFFTEVGTALLKSLSAFDAGAEALRPAVLVGTSWSDRDFLNARTAVRERQHEIHVGGSDLPALKSFFVEKKAFLLGLLENPNLLEHESFTDLLWAVSHLAEELEIREDVNSLPDSDLAHIAGDIKRAYSHLLSEWLMYVKHLKEEYPYLFSVVVRMNPFDPDASPIVR